MIDKLKNTARNYLEARQAFLEVANKSEWLFGNDNIVGRIGEFIALQYLNEQNRNPIRPKSKTEKGFDFLCDNNKTKVTVKTITSENIAGSTTKISEPWDELILITINEKLLVEKIGILTKSELNEAFESNFLKSKSPFARRSMVGEKGLITKFGKILQNEEVKNFL